MAKIIFGMNQSLDGYVDHEHFAPDPELFQHFVERVRATACSVYGRRLYEVMRYWDEEHPEWDTASRAFAEAWRNQPKWVASTSLKSVGPNATLITGNFETFIRELKENYAGEIDAGGTFLARSLSDLGLIDEYHMYLHPVVLGHGKPFFAGPHPPPLRLDSSERIGQRAIRLIYVPA